MPAFRLALAAFLAALATAPAQAEILGWRYISGDLQAATSTCIGSNESPACVADTLIACFIVLYDTPIEDEDAAFSREPCRSASRFAWEGLARMPRGMARDGFLYFYLLEIYPLADEPHPASRRDSPPTDVVVDIYAGSCSAAPPLPVEQDDDQWNPRPRICTGFPFEFPGRVSEDGGLGLEGFIQPSMSLRLRQETDGYHAVGAHWQSPPASNMGGIRLLGPDRWYESLERLLIIDRGDPSD